MLEHWYREKRTLRDFRRGPVGPHFDGFAAALKAQGYRCGAKLLSKCCQFNAFLVEQGVTRPAQISPAHLEAFLDVYTEHIGSAVPYSPRANARRALRRLYDYLIQVQACRPPPQPKSKPTPYTWILEPYLRHLRQDGQLAEATITRARERVGGFLSTLGPAARRPRLRRLRPEQIENFLRPHLQDSPQNREALATSLRRFLHYCARHHYTPTDYAGLIPPVRRYRLASLPKGIEDSALSRMLRTMDTTTALGARDYAMIMLMMAYGLRAVSVAALLLDDLDWRHSHIRIRAQKGGKEVVLPLMEAVGEALIRYLRHRPARTPFREVFLTTKAPWHPLTNLLISHAVRGYLHQAGVQLPGAGARSLRHSWAIRALAHDTPIKAIADVLGHRYIDTTFIYAKADLNSLREVAMPWPQKG
jgi:site-specific recombinase XerD